MKTPTPIEFRSADSLPSGPWLYEPKWDGFRCIVARDGAKLTLTSKRGQTLGRYFPELVARCLAMKAKNFILDGEIIMRCAGATFDDLTERIHPAESRVRELAKRMPTSLMIFDLLSDGRANIACMPLRERRDRLTAFAAKYFGKAVGIKLSPATTNRPTAQRWLADPHPATDGVIAKDLRLPYTSGTREAGYKIKPARTADCVVGGFRYASNGRGVGSLLLGLYDRSGKLHHVGFTSGLTDADRRALLPILEKLIKPPGFTGTAPGGPSRWSTGRTEHWEPLDPRLVVEVGFDRVTGDRIRHGARFIRWRLDKKPRACTMDQLNT